MATTPATLKDLAVQVRDLYLDARTGAQADVSAAQARLTAARDAQKQHAAGLVAKNTGIADRQKQLPEVSSVPADAAELLDEIAGLQVEARALQGTLLDDGDAVAGAEAAMAAAQGFLTRVAAGFARADQQVRPDGRGGYTGPAEADEARRQGWRDAAPALDAAVGDAAAHQLDDADTLYKRAKAKVDAEVPAGLLAAARDGYTLETRRRAAAEGSVARIEDLLAARRQSDGGPEGSADALALELERAEDELRRWSEEAASRYALAVTQLSAFAPVVVDPNAPPVPPLFTAGEQAKLASLGAAGDAAVALRSPRDDARADLIEAQADALDAGTEALADDPTGYDGMGSPPDASPPGSPPGSVDDAEEALAAAEQAYTAQMRKDFAAWSAAVPEAVWRRLVGFVEAEATLQELRNGDPAALVEHQQDAEAALAQARWAAERHALTAAYLEEQVKLREALAARALSVRQQRLLSALRGDA